MSTQELMNADPAVREFHGKRMFLVGIKGAGMSALAELLTHLGATVQGSDTDEVFYTDEVLKQAGITYYERFDADLITPVIDLVVHSTVYDVHTHPQLLAAKRLGCPILSYHEALGIISSTMYSVGISGTHGKSTTTGITGTCVDAVGLPASVLAAAAITNFGRSPVLFRGSDYFIAETCEYKRHFLSFHPKVIVVTSIELDHPDYFSGIADVEDAFASYVDRLPSGGRLIYCADDEGAAAFGTRVSETRPDLILTPYGTSADGDYRIHDIDVSDGAIGFMLGDFASRFTLRIPGMHNIRNAAAATAATLSLCLDRNGEITSRDVELCASSIGEYRGSVRRSEIIGEGKGVTILDDYGHHPTAIRTTVAGLRQFYPGRRIVLDFMPHTFSRTQTLFDDFVTAFDDADILILNDIYTSARENSGSVSGEDLYRAVRKRRDNVWFYPDFDACAGFLQELLKPGDVFVTMGAGDNWKIGRSILRILTT